jgi:hypothetical protein
MEERPDTPRESSQDEGAQQERDTLLPSMAGYKPPVEGADDEWVPEEAIEALNMEKQYRPAETNEEMAERIFEENLPVAAQAVCHLALNAGNSQVRFAAARYVIERKLGKVVDPSQIRKDGTDPLLAFMGDVTMSDEDYAQIKVNAGVGASGAEGVSSAETE